MKLKLVVCVVVMLLTLIGCIKKPDLKTAAPDHGSVPVAVKFVSDSDWLNQPAKVDTSKYYYWHTSYITNVTASDDGRFIASVSPRGKSIILWNTANHKPDVKFTLTTNTRTYGIALPIDMGIAFSPDSRYLAFGGDDRVLSIWDIKNNKMHRTIKTDSTIVALSYNPDGKSIAYSSSTNEVKVIRIMDGENIATLKHNTAIEVMTYDRSGKRIVTVFQGRRYGKYVRPKSLSGSSIKVWNVSENRLIKSIPFKGQVSSIKASPDNELIVALVYGPRTSSISTWALKGDGPDEVAHFDVPTRKIEISEPHEDNGFGIDFSADGKYLLSGAEGDSINIWEVKTKKLIKRLDLRNTYLGTILLASFAKNDSEIITSGSGSKGSIASYQTEGGSIETGDAYMARVKGEVEQEAGRKRQYKADDANKLNQLKKSAELGSVGAQYALAKCMLGQSIIAAPDYCDKKDIKESAKWYRKAAEQGHASAQAQIGKFYLLGRGVPKNYTEAKKWLRKASDQGDAYAKKNLKIIEHKIQHTKNRKKIAEDIETLRNGNPIFKRCYEMMIARLTTCNVSIGNCDSLGCGNDTSCDTKDGRNDWVGFHPCERELNLHANEFGTYYCDEETLRYSRYKDDAIMNECTYQ